MQAINNYAVVLKSEDYFWTHEWTLEDFLSRGLGKFVEEAHPLTNFLKKESIIKTEHDRIIENAKKVAQDGRPFPVGQDVTKGWDSEDENND